MKRKLPKFLILRLSLFLILGCSISNLITSAQEPRLDRDLFNGQDLTGWEGDKRFWAVKDGVIVGSSNQPIKSNQYLWADVEVENFYLSLDVRILPDSGNGGINFRSRRASKTDIRAVGYQADVGRSVWGRLYHQYGRGKLDWNDRGEKVVKKGKWNRYEILAVGRRIWLAINGKLSVSFYDPKAELKGRIAFQLHAGAPQKIEYKIDKLIHDPVVTLAGLTKKQLLLDANPALKKRAGSVERFSDNKNFDTQTKQFKNKIFQLEEQDTVVFVGGANTVRSRLDGTLEALLSISYATKKPRFRNMAWEGDTVYEQWRDIGFGTWIDQLQGVGASVVFVDFGQMEAIEGVERLKDFVKAYEKLLDGFQRVTKRIVLLTPRPFETPRSPHMPDHTGKNSTAKQYAEAIKKLAKERDLIAVDLFTPLVSTKKLTSNGVHLLADSHSKVARLIAKSLGVPILVPTQFNSLLSAIREKNRLWHDNWRPMNWSFAYGDRTRQPFSRSYDDHPSLKTELAAFKPLLQNVDQQIHRIAMALAINEEVPEFKSVTSNLKYPQQEVDPARHTPEAQLKTFRVAEGFEVNLFASEADGVVKPVKIRWDDQGRLWVACIPTYPHIEPGAKPGDYILVCEDTNNDGKADKFHRFAEGLFIPMGIEFGDGGVYVSEATDFVLLKDTDGDGKADSREIILSGFGTADSHQMINNTHRGPLGDFWFTQGHHAYSRVETPWGISKLSKAGVWRYRPGTGQLDSFFSYSKAGLNGQGVTHDDWAQTFHNSAALSGGFYTVAGSINAEPKDALPPLVNPPQRNTGIEFIGTEHLPNEMQGEIVWSGFMNNNIQRRRLVDLDAGFKAELRPNLLQSTERNFRPVNAKVGPDGAIYICDWYNPTIGHYQASYRDPKRDRTRGRIWRLRAKDRPLSKAPSLVNMNPSQLLEQLSSKERLTRINAKKLLFDLPKESVILATQLFITKLEQDGDYERLLLEAAGIYAAHEVVEPEVLQLLLTSDDPRVRAIGARFIGRWHLRLENPLELLRKSIQDEHPRVRLEAIIAASYMKSANAMEVAAMAQDQPRDRFINYALKLCVQALKPYWQPALAQGKFDFGESPERLQMVLELDGTSDSAKFIGELTRIKGLSEESREGLLAMLAGLGKPSDLQYVMDHSRLSPVVLQSLVTAAEVYKIRPDGEVQSKLRPLLSSSDEKVRSLAISLIGHWKIQSLVDEVRHILTQKNTPPAVLESALLAISRMKGIQATDEIGPFVSPNQSPRIQLAVVRAVSLFDLRGAAQIAASTLTESKNEKLTQEIVVLFLNRNEGTKILNRALVDLISAGTPLKADPALLMHRAMSGAGRSDEELLTTINKALGKKAAKVAEYSVDYVKTLAQEVRQSGNARRGGEVYRSKIANCSSCHRLNGKGGTQGPDLSIIGAGRSEELLIESVLWPNRQIREGYMSVHVITNQGLILTGYPIKETEKELHLREISTNKTRRIAKESILSRQEAGSIMPANLVSGMTRDELRDLIRYLSELRGSGSE